MAMAMTGHEHAADLIRKSCDGRFGVARLVHQPDDLRQGGVVAHAGGAEAEGAVFIDGGGDDRIPSPFSTGMLSPVMAD